MSGRVALAWSMKWWYKLYSHFGNLMIRNKWCVYENLSAGTSLVLLCHSKHNQLARKTILLLMHGIVISQTHICKELVQHVIHIINNIIKILSSLISLCRLDTKYFDQIKGYSIIYMLDYFRCIDWLVLNELGTNFLYASLARYW